MSVELRREVARARRRRTFGIVAAVGVPSAAVAIAIVMAPRERVRTEHAITAHVVTVPIPIAVEYRVAIPEQRAACPPPRRDAPRGVQPAQPPVRVDRVRPAETNAGWIAAWNAEHVFLSFDAGASWQRALDGAGEVRDVAFDCHGRAIAVRGERVGIREGAAERWHRVRGLELADDYASAAVIGGGPDVVIVGHAPRAPDDVWRGRLAVSRDLGATWELRDLAHYWEGAPIRGRQHEDGRILASLDLPDCMGEYAWVFEYRDGAVTHHDTSLDAELAFAGDVVVASSGWKRLGTDVTTDYEGVAGYPRVVAGPDPLLLADGVLYRFRNGRLAKLPWKLDPAAWSIVADAAGRVWSLTGCGTLQIATTAPVTRGSDPRGGSSDGADAAGCDPS